jgi:NitT/TauT family transport system ATP-binding protein
VPVLKDISFTAERQETICILGPSGCGKSTILRVVSGMYQRHLKMPTSGVVRVRGVTTTGPHDEVLTVFQRPVLKAWLNVRENIALPFKAPLWGKRVSRKEQSERVEEVLVAVGLSSAAGLRPRQLSGGMQQRVSLAARLVLRPSILCLDEPFSALDPQTRFEMQELVLKIWRHFPCLGLFVTHDVTEALRVADRIIVLSTRPATIIMDITIVEPKPRPEAWFRGAECTQLEQQIIARVREAASSTARGTLNVDV